MNSSVHSNSNEKYAVYNESGKFIRKKDVWPGNISFYCHAACVKGDGDYQPIYGIILMIIPVLMQIPMIIYFNNAFAYISLSLSVITLISALVFFILTACSDPGILERFTADEEDFQS